MKFRIKELEDLVKHHRSLYYNYLPQIDDDEFDALEDELRTLDPKNKVLLQVGAPISDDSHWIKIKHEIPMHSLDKFNYLNEVQEWCSKYIKSQFCVQEKLDGISISAEYVNGNLSRVLTRGGGDEGEDITRNAIKVKGIKTVLNSNFTGFFRGEIMLLEQDYIDYNKKAELNGWNLAKNKRNGASGLARRLSGDGAEFLTAMFYTVVGVDFKTNFDMMNHLSTNLELLTPNYFLVNAKQLSTLYSEYENSKRDSLKYEIDGLVIKIDNIDESAKIDDEGTSNPKSQRAWKFAAKGAVSPLLRVEGEFGVGGNITPVGTIKPVQIGDVTVSRVSLHNWPMVKDMDLRIGSLILVERANDVIPKVIRVISNDNTTPIEIPTHCPVCKEEVEFNGKLLTCYNDNCYGIISGKIQKWITNLEVDNFGTSIIDPLVYSGKIKTIADLYSLKDSDISKLDRQGERSAEKALVNLHAKKSVTLATLIGSLNIRSFGVTLATQIVENGFNTLEKIFNLTIKDLIALDGFEVRRANDIINGINLNKELIQKMSTILNIKEPASQNFAGKTICITGKLQNPKKYYEDLIINSGYQYADSVSSDLDYLVVEDINGSSSKLQKAKKLNIKIITESDLLNLIKI